MQESQQQGTLLSRGKAGQEVWYVRYRVKDAKGVSSQRSVVLGKMSELSRRAALKKQQEVVNASTVPVAPVLQGDRSSMPVKQFYEERFLPLKHAWSAGHRASFLKVMELYILPHVGTHALADVDKISVQSVLNIAASRGLSQSTVKHVREKMFAVFEEAYEQEFITRNPVRKTKASALVETATKHVLSPTQIMDLLYRLDDKRDKAIFALGAFCALRTSEIFGMKWGSLNVSKEKEHYIFVQRIAFGGKLTEKTKTKSSKAYVPVPAIVTGILKDWMEDCNKTGVDDLMFPSTNRNGRGTKGQPMWSGSWLTKRLQPKAAEAGIEFPVTFRVTRRTVATLVQSNGIGSLKDAQSFLRHSSPATTSEVYTMPVLDATRRAGEGFADFVTVEGTKPKKGMALVKKQA